MPSLPTSTNIKTETQFCPVDVATDYSRALIDPARNQYERNVNWLCIKSLLPDAPTTILDYGAASGEYSKKMRADGHDVTAVDNSLTLVRLLDHAPEKGFHWTYTDQPLNRKFGVILVKMVVPFIDDLPRFAHTMRDHLETGGSAIISVPHPYETAQKVKGLKVGMYEDIVDDSGIELTMWHRDIEEFDIAFGAADFIPREALEPIDPSAPHASPKRLNMLWEAA